MKLIAGNQRARVWLGSTTRPYAFSSPCEGDEFALLLLVNDLDVSPDEQSELSEQFVRQGCRYAVCAGHDCSSWDDSIDMVSVMDEVEGNPGPFVVTTWHDNESLEDILFFFVTCTTFDDWAAENFVILLIGNDAELEARVRADMKARFV